jgi:hypothetical protein
LAQANFKPATGENNDRGFCALGGFAGGQDGTRMNWLYERFAELTAQEIRGGTPKQAKS